MTERARLEAERERIEERLIELRSEVDALERDRLRVHDAIGALVGASAVSVCAAYTVAAGHGYHCTLPRGHDGAHGAQGVQWGPEFPAPAGRERCPDAQLPDGPTCPRCGGARMNTPGGSWAHCQAPESSL